MELAIQIDSGVPIPKRNVGRRRGPYKYPWLDMARGQSFVFPGDTTDWEAYRDRAQGGTAQAGKRYGRKFKTRAVVENGQRVIRIWRTE
jgi:hypothetical protein